MNDGPRQIVSDLEMEGGRVRLTNKTHILNLMGMATNSTFLGTLTALDPQWIPQHQNQIKAVRRKHSADYVMRSNLLTQDGQLVSRPGNMCRKTRQKEYMEALEGMKYIF